MLLEMINGKFRQRRTSRGATLAAAAGRGHPMNSIKVLDAGDTPIRKMSREARLKPKTRSWTFQESSGGYHRPQNGLGDIYYIDVSAVKIVR